MDTVTLTYIDGIYRGDYASTDNKLLITITIILSLEIRDSHLYREFLNKSPFEFIGNGYYLNKVENYIVYGGNYSTNKYYIPYANFLDLMSQWEKTNINLPKKINISMDEEKKFKIIYENSNNKAITSYSSNLCFKNFQPSSYIKGKNYIELKSLNEKLIVSPIDNKILNMFALLLTSNIAIFDSLKNIEQGKYEYSDNRYFITIIEDRILIYDTYLDIKALPPLNKFLQLLAQWKLIGSTKPKLIKLYIDDDYNFKLIES